jgi:hypothetical protein
MLNLPSQLFKPQPKQPKTNSQVCTRCGNKFTNPLLTIATIGENTESYYGCPRCLTPVPDAENSQPEETENSTNNKTPEKNKSPPTCTHSLGYLKQRPKGTPVPEDCFTCTAMIDCMSSH